MTFVARYKPILIAFLLAQHGLANAAQCWTNEVVGASRIREMEIMVMAAGLRCKGLGFDISDSLEKFRSNQKDTIRVADTKLRKHFGAEQSKSGKIEYDRFLTKLGNRYGAGATDSKTCGMFNLIANELADPRATGEDMEMIALNLVRDPYLDAEKCLSK